MAEHLAFFVFQSIGVWYFYKEDEMFFMAICAGFATYHLACIFGL